MFSHRLSDLPIPLAVYTIFCACFKGGICSPFILSVRVVTLPNQNLGALTECFFSHSIGLRPRYFSYDAAFQAINFHSITIRKRSKPLGTGRLTYIFTLDIIFALFSPFPLTSIALLSKDPTHGDDALGAVV